MTTIVTRLAHADDAAAIHAVHAAAFPTEDEAHLVDALEAAGDDLASVVALDRGEVASHVLFSRMHVGETPAVALAPVATRPDRQRRGFAAAAIEEGLRLCRLRGERIVLVLGDPGYYRRFGFAEAAAGIVRPWPGPPFMALALTPGALERVAGRVRYAPSFGIPE